MCGIYATNLPLEKDEVIRKLNTIRFRGPDNTGYDKTHNVTLGHLRLSILDLDERSNQPFDFNQYKIVFNGEIYNFEHIREALAQVGYQFHTGSDTEVLIKGYDHWGKDVLNKLNGMFAFVIYDTNSNKLFCARDRLGVKPFFYYWRDGVFEISSQMRPLFNQHSRVSENAVSIYLDLGYVPSPYSILENVYKLEPGHYMEIDANNGIYRIAQYWDLKVSTNIDISYEDAKDELHALIKDAVKIRMKADVPIGSFLSGGVDSALITAIASKSSSNQINTFTIGFNEPKYDESKIAKSYAEILNTKHIETICSADDVLSMIPHFISAFDEPMADSSALASLLLSSVTKNTATVALSGDGGDESFLGYMHFDMLGKFNVIEKVPFIIRNWLGAFNWYKLIKSRPETIKNILKSETSNDFIWKIFTGFETNQVEKYTDWESTYDFYKTSSLSPYQRMADLNIKLWLENDSNVKVDRASMAFSVEVRSPFLDYRIVEYARSLPIEYRYQKGNKKRILKDILSEYIPFDVFNQPKKGFSIPLDMWFRNELKDEIKDRLNDSFLRKIPNLKVDIIKQKIDQHLSGQFNYSYLIWRLYVLSCWYEEFEKSTTDNFR